jgi:hypothetical protein
MLIFSMLTLMSTLAFASEPRINVLTGGNNLSTPEDGLDVYNFPHTLGANGSFVYADAMSEYIAYAGGNWIASINRSSSQMNNIGIAREPIIDLGYSNGSTGIIGTIGLEDAGANQILSFSARASTGSDGAALAAEVSFVAVEVADTGIRVGVDARLDRDGGNFKYLIVSASLASKDNSANTLSNGGGTDIEASALLADNDMITDDIRLLYGVGLGVELLDGVTTAISIPTYIGAEIDAKKWLTLRAGGTREWRMDSWDKALLAGPAGTTYATESTIAFGLGLTSGALSIDADLRTPFLHDGIVFEKNGFSQHTSLTYSF